MVAPSHSRDVIDRRPPSSWAPGWAQGTDNTNPHCRPGPGNLRGRWGRTKRWDYWSVLAGDITLAITYADVGYLGTATIWWADLATGTTGGRDGNLPLARGVSLPDRPGSAPLSYRGNQARVDIGDDPDGTTIKASWIEKASSSGPSGPRAPGSPRTASSSTGASPRSARNSPGTTTGTSRSDPGASTTRLEASMSPSPSVRPPQQDQRAGSGVRGPPGVRHLEWARHRRCRHRPPGRGHPGLRPRNPGPAGDW